MSEHQKQIELEMRLAAIEFMLCKVFASLIVAGGKTDAQNDAGLNEIGRQAAGQKFPGLDAAYSDLASDEFSIAVQKLTDSIKAMARQLRRP